MFFIHSTRGMKGVIMHFLTITSVLCLLLQTDGQSSGARRIYGPVLFPGSCQTATGSVGQCRLASSCFSILDDGEYSLAECVQPNGDPGLCCPLSPSAVGVVSTNAIYPPAEARTPYVPMPDITVDDVNKAGQIGVQQHQNVVKLENELVQRGLFVRKNTPEAFHQAFFGSSKKAQSVAKLGFVGLEIALDIYNKFQLNPKQGRDGLMQLDLKRTEYEGICPRQPYCVASKYRTQDGSCNNLKHGLWGKSFTAFQRFLPPKYIDGVNLPRIASDGGPLPSAREVSAMATPDMDVPHSTFTLLTMQWGQFLDHDLTVTAITKTARGDGIKCCAQEIQTNPRLRHPECFEIDISKDDPFYSIHQQTCMEFVRSAPAPRSDCNLGPREQLNQLTAYIDGSMIYGSTHEETAKLRSFAGGRMKVTRYNNADMLPRDLNKSEECAQRQTDLYCFMAGDERVNEQISLTTMHTIWMREHNRVAGELLRLNPDWIDEAVFQEAKRVVAAEIQHITYNEFLPLLLGRQVIRAFGLRLEPSGYSYKYDAEVNPSIANVFAAAAYRYGHTLVQGKVKMVNSDNTKVGEIPLSTQFFNPVMLYTPGNLDRFIRGLTATPAQRFDRFVTSQLTNHLFEIPGHGYGLDLIALNIQRGRDHGIPGYNDWREHCGFQRMYTFEDLNKVMNEHTVRAFRKLYRHVDDIDLFPAGVAEFSIANATLGPSFACIVAEQFRRLKVGDRFWYENGGQSGTFSEAQLQEIRKVSIARIICDNSDDIKQIQPLAFIGPMPWNQVMSCYSSQIPYLNLAMWKSEPVAI